MRHTRYIAIALLLAACQPANTTTTTIETDTTTPPTPPVTTTIQPATTTTTIRDTTTTIRETTTTAGAISNWREIIDAGLPEDATTVDELPTGIADQFDTTAPQPDLTLAGPEDLDRWLTQWIAWMIWIGANPTEGADQVEVGWIPGTPQADATVQGLTELAERNQRTWTLPFNPTSATGTFDDLFESNQILTVFVDIDDTIPSYTIESDGTVETTSPSGEQLTIRLVLRPDENNQWRVEQIQSE